MKRGHYPRKPIDERVWSRVNIPHEGFGCWEWGGRKNACGYGTVSFLKKSTLVHRWVYASIHGEIPEGKCICHSCDNPACVNPSHLWEGTQQENIQDAVGKGRMRGSDKKGQGHSQAKLTDEDVLAIRRRTSSGEQQGVVAKDYGVSTATVCNIHHRKSWTHLSD